MFPGEQDDVTEDKERQNKGEPCGWVLPGPHNAGLPTCIPRGLSPSPYPHSLAPAPRPRRVLILNALLQAGPQSCMAGSASPRLVRHRRADAKITLLRDTPRRAHAAPDREAGWEQEQETSEGREGRRGGREGPERREDAQPLAFSSPQTEGARSSRKGTRTGTPRLGPGLSSSVGCEDHPGIPETGVCPL